MGGSLPPFFNTSFPSNALHSTAGYEYFHPSSNRLSGAAAAPVVSEGAVDSVHHRRDFDDGISVLPSLQDIDASDNYDSSCSVASEFCFRSTKLVKMEVDSCRIRSSSAVDYSCKAAVTESTYQRRLKLQEMKLHYCAEELGSESAADYTYYPAASCRSYSGDFDGSSIFDGAAATHHYPAAAVSRRTSSDSSDSSAAITADADSVQFVSDEESSTTADSAVSNSTSTCRRFNRYSSFPPPLPHSLPPPESDPGNIVHPDACSTTLCAFRHDGRLILRQIPVPCRRYLSAHRSGGRLTLRLLTRTSSDGCLDVGPLIFDVETADSAAVDDDRRHSGDGPAPTEVADSDDNTNQHLRDPPPEPPSAVLLSEPPCSPAAALLGGNNIEAAACDHGSDHWNSHAAATVEGKAAGRQQCRRESKAIATNGHVANPIASTADDAYEGGDDADGLSIYIERELLQESVNDPMTRAILMRLIHELAAGYQKIHSEEMSWRRRPGSAMEPLWLRRSRRKEARSSSINLKGMDAYAEYVTISAREKDVILRALLVVMAEMRSRGRAAAAAAEVMGRRRCEMYEGRSVAI